MSQRVLMLGWGYPPNIDGGLDIHVKELFEKLKDQGMPVDLALPEERAPEKRGIIPLESESDEMIPKSRELSQSFVELAKNYDIVHTHDWFGAEAGLKAKKHADVKWVSTFHSLSSQRSRNASAEIQKLERCMAERSDRLIAVSQKLADQVKEEFGKTPEVIHNGFSVPEYSGRDIKSELDIENMVFFVGRHAEQKGLKHLLYGFSKFNGEATLVIGGKGGMTSQLKDFADILGVKEDVDFVGFIPDKELGDYYRSADVFISPSLDEPFGLTVTEALESGTPAVVTEAGVEEILPEDAIVNVELNSRSIADGIKRGLNIEVPEFESRSWKTVAKETAEIYRDLN